MLIPEFLYQFTRPKDAVQQHLQILQRSATLNSAALSLSRLIYENVGDNVVILGNASCQASCTGAVDIQELFLTFTGSNGGLERFSMLTGVDEGPTGEEALNRALNWSGQLWLMPGSQVSVHATFDAIGADNTVTGYIQGIKIPRGNVTYA